MARHDSAAPARFDAAPARRGARDVDPRVVLLQVLLAAACGFCLNTVAAGAVAALLISCLLAFLGQPKSALVLLAWTCAVNAICQAILMVEGWGAFGAFVVVFFVLRKAIPLAGAALLFWSGLTVSRLVAVLTHMRFPKNLTLTLAVAYRFIPTIGYEVGAIRDALAMRGRRLSILGVLAAPREMCESVLVPLMMRCTRVADELAASATARAIENPAPRTTRHHLAFRAGDWAMLALTAAAAAAVMAIEGM